MIEQVDRVDRHRHVGRVLTRGQVELLLRADPVFMGDLVPVLQIVLGEIAIGPLDVHLAELGHDGEHRVDPARTGIVGVDQEGDVLEVRFWHGLPLIFRRRDANHAAGVNSPLFSSSRRRTPSVIAKWAPRSINSPPASRS